MPLIDQYNRKINYSRPKSLQERGKQVEDNFEYTSKNNKKFLIKKEIKKLIRY